MDEAAGLMVTWPTSYEVLLLHLCSRGNTLMLHSQALHGRAQLKPGEWVLVTAGAGGVGLSAVQLAKGHFISYCRQIPLTLKSILALGAKVIATAGSPEKLEICKREGGADYVLDYTKDGWQKEVMKITGGKGAGELNDTSFLISYKTT